MNAAYEEGLRKHSWWPDWRGECVAIVAGGPSIKGMDLSILKDRIHVVAIKVAVDLCPWAEVCYGCDAPWWMDRRGLPKFKGLKLAHGPATSEWAEIRRITIEIAKDEILLSKPLTVGNGGCSGFQALNLVAQFGATDIILIGYDLRDGREGPHWYGRNKWVNANNPMPSNYARWQKGFKAAAPTLKKAGVAVVNVSPGTELEAFPKADLKSTMEEWGLC